MGKRRYPKVSGYWVYVIQIPSICKFYVGVSKRQCYQRWKKSEYKSCLLKEYISEWQDMNKNVIQDNLTREEALQLEDALIQVLSRYNLCINEQRSGLIKVSDVNAYNREKRKQHSEKYNENRRQRNANDAEYRERNKQRSKQWWENNKEQINEKRRQRYQRKKLEQQTVVP